jgi:hypothetical protein
MLCGRCVSIPDFLALKAKRAAKQPIHDSTPPHSSNGNVCEERRKRITKGHLAAILSSIALSVVSSGCYPTSTRSNPLWPTLSTILAQAQPILIPQSRFKVDVPKVFLVSPIPTSNIFPKPVKQPKLHTRLPQLLYNNPFLANSIFLKVSPALKPPLLAQTAIPSPSSTLSSFPGKAQGQWCGTWTQDSVPGHR